MTVFVITTDEPAAREIIGTKYSGKVTFATTPAAVKKMAVGSDACFVKCVSTEMRHAAGVRKARVFAFTQLAYFVR